MLVHGYLCYASVILLTASTAQSGSCTLISKQVPIQENVQLVQKRNNIFLVSLHETLKLGSSMAQQARPPVD